MSTYLSQINAALDRDDTLAAARIAEQALSAGASDGIVYNLVAWLREEDGEYEEAEALIRQAIAADPSDPTLLVGLGVVLRKQGHMREAAESFDRAIQLDSGYAAAWFERGATYERGGAISDAGDDYRQALRIEPENADFMAALANVLARLGKLNDAKQMAGAALSRAPRTSGALRALAQIAIEEKRYADALDALDESMLPMDDAGAGLHTLRGDALEGLGRFDEAYKAYCKGNAVFLEQNQTRMAEAGPDELLDRIERSAANFSAIDVSGWSSSEAYPPSLPSRHVFLLGHPRSGTTLAENILASLPGAIAIEERPTILGLGREIVTGPDGFTKFASLSGHALDQARVDYWNRAERAAETKLDGRIFIDMDPFKGSRLPMLARLFPAAKYVVTQRDPRDVVWSCFHTNFAYNAATATFATLESTARYYAANWTILQSALDRMPLDWFALRYESLVRDFDATTQALCEFLGVPWSEDLRQFDRTAQRRGVSTASASQVRQGLYDGSGGWRRYEKHLEPVLPILQPWLDRFGYA